MIKMKKLIEDLIVVKTVKATLIIGDVHGCIHELKALWAKVSPDAQTRIIFLGDLIDRGPHSATVVNFVRDKAKTHELILIQGNHEVKAIKRWEQGHGSDVGLEQAHIDFLKTGLPFYAFENGRFIAVHGGIYPAFCEHYTQLPDLKEQANWERKLKDRVSRFYFCRYVNTEGNTVSLGQQSDDDNFWADVYTGQYGTAFFGHQPFFSGPVVFPHAVSLDTGCAFGGKLSAAYIDENCRISFVSVKADDAYGSYINYGNEIADYPRQNLQVPHLSFSPSN